MTANMTSHTPTPPRQTSPTRPKRVLLIGWDAADWQLITPLIAQGHMPTLARMIEQGVSGNLASMQPMLSPLLWNSIATGKRPDQHGVHGFTEPDPNAATVRPVSSTSRNCKALWNIATQAGLRTHVVGWYASHPAEPILGTMVSNQFEHVRLEPDGSPSAPAPMGVHPPSETDRLANLRVAPAEIDASAILPFIPDAARLAERNEGKHVGALRQLIAQTATVHAVSTDLLARDDWDLACLYYEGIDRFKHEFMDFHPPKLDAVSDEDFNAYQHCVNGAYRFHDMLLETLLTIASTESDTAVILISDHGYTSGPRRPTPEQAAANPAACHRPFGVFCAQGPGFTPNARLFGASLLDIAPTILDLLGLPPALDMPGRVLSEVLTTPQPIDRITSWEGVGAPDGSDAGMHPADLRIDPAESQEALAQLIELGYIEAPTEDAEKTVRDTIAVNRITLAESQMDAAQPKRALETLAQLEAPYATQPNARMVRITARMARDRRADARAEIAALRGQLPPAHRAAPRLDLMLGAIELADKNTDEALAILDRLAKDHPTMAGLQSRLGAVLHEVGQFERAASAFRAALAENSDDVKARVGLARTHLRTGEPEAALDEAMTAAELVHNLPGAHHIIGESLVELGRPADAVQALTLALAQAPQYARAKRALIRAHRALDQHDRAAELEAELIAAGERLGNTSPGR